LPLLIDWLQNSRTRNSESGKLEAKKVTSLFMGSPNTPIGKTASAIADNVLFTWRDSLTGRFRQDGVPDPQRTVGQDGTSSFDFQGGRGVAVYLDRAQGRSPGGQLWWFPDETQGRGPTLAKHECHDRTQLARARAMIDRIQAMQGFDVQSETNVVSASKGVTP
jgi:hypothetical protein